MAGAGIAAASGPSAPSTPVSGADAGPSTHPIPTQPIRYQVFLSFRGPDSRKTFTDHLYAALDRKGLVTFRDGEEIEKGEYVPKKLRKAIQQSWYFIIVLSQKFASSRWCLDELQQIVETKPEQTVFPVFYDVEPRDIVQALAVLEQTTSREITERWRQALSRVSKFSGWPTKDRHEAKLVEEIATCIWNKVCDQLPYNLEHLVGDIQSKVERIISHLAIGFHHKRFIGIWGMGGAGKTTLARVVYDAVRKNFDASCFLADIRGESKKFGLVHLQKKLLSDLLKIKEPNIKDFFDGADTIRSFLRHKKVLIVLDDVSHGSQLRYLARNEEWFGAGSKIIITTRDKHLLTQYENSYEHKVDMLRDDESLKLLRQEAFKKDQSGEVFTSLSNKIVGYAGGHPMALEVLGSFLRARKHYEWTRTIDRLKQNLRKEILSRLRISYDELEEEYKTVFLDIACFYNKEAKYKVKNVLKICGLDEIVGIKVLTERSLLSSSQSNLIFGTNARESQNMYDSHQKKKGNTGMAVFPYMALEEEASKEYLYMHDLLQEMGRNIVLQESPINAGRRSRLWSLEDIDLVLKENKGTEHVQSIVLKTHQRFKADWDPNCFSKMINLRLLELSKVQLLRKLESLPTALRFLRWDDYAEDCLPSIEELQHLESLQLCNSRIRSLWEGRPLRTIDLSNSNDLMETPDFSGTPNLEGLLLNRCTQLVKVHESVGQLKKLVKLSLKECGELEILPPNLKTGELAEFILNGCLRLKKLPEFSENMGSLYFLDVSYTGITEIPPSIKYLKNLRILNLWDCKLKIPPTALPEDLPSGLIVCGHKSSTNTFTISESNDLPASPVLERPVDLQGPVHILGEFRAGAAILEWCNCTGYHWGKDPSAEFVTITADIPSEADSNEECWGIAICLFLKPPSLASQSCYIVWRLEDYCHTNKTNKMEENLTPDDDWVVYVGFYPFKLSSRKKDKICKDLTLSILKTGTGTADHRDWAIMGCRWRWTRKHYFDEWLTERETSESELQLIGSVGRKIIEVGGAYSPFKGIAACGGIIKDGQNYCFVEAFILRPISGDILTAELWGCLMGLRRAWDLHFKDIIVRSNSKKAVDLIHSHEELETAKDWDVVREIKTMMSRNWRVELEVILPDKNSQADSLAKRALISGSCGPQNLELDAFNRFMGQ